MVSECVTGTCPATPSQQGFTAAGLSIDQCCRSWERREDRKCLEWICARSERWLARV